MLLKNNSQKVIHVGSVMILPEETKHVDDSLSTAPAVAALISRKALAVVGNIAKVPATEPAKEPVGEEAGGKAPGNDNDGGEPPVGEGKKPLSRMNKQELTEECLKLGLDILGDDTKYTLLEKIRAATAE